MRKIVAATTPVYGGVSSSRSGSHPPRQARRSTERGEVIPSDRTRGDSVRATPDAKDHGGPRTQQTKDGFKSEWQPHTTGVTPPVFTRPGKTLSLPRLTVHWLSVTRATKGRC